MDPRDAVRADISCDNHRRTTAPASSTRRRLVDVLPAVKRAVGRMTVMLDSGVRRGARHPDRDVPRAQFCFFGQPTSTARWRAGSRGSRGGDIFRGEIDLVMGRMRLPELGVTRPRLPGPRLAAQPLMPGSAG
jgi:hypothetical protein